MKLIGIIVASALCLFAATHRASGQIAQQVLGFAFVGQYGTNLYSTNITMADTTNEILHIGGVYVNTPDIVNAIAIDVAGPAWTNWVGGVLVRNTTLSTGAQAIYLRKGAVETNVSSFFGGSFSNDFTANVEDNFSGFTNTTYYADGVLYGFTNAAYKGILSTVGNTPTRTNFIQSARLFSVSLNTANLKFNLLTYGTTVATNMIVKYKGTNYNQWVDSVAGIGVGNFAVNLGTNTLFGRNYYETTNFVSGPANGSILLHPPVFSAIPGP